MLFRSGTVLLSAIRQLDSHHSHPTTHLDERVRYRLLPANISVMAYLQDSRGLDFRMQRIIEAAGAGNEEELFADTPFSLPGGPAAQAPPKFSHHSNNGSSLQDMFAYQASPPTRSSLVRPLMPQDQALRAGYQPESYSEHHHRRPSSY